jgi:cytochrome oxidase Cu insertion factor (SCO1/SenC/PrrC family)
MKLRIMALICVVFVVLALSPVQAQQHLANHTDYTDKTNKVYSCPMHPDVKKKSKGKCPKCGMDLRPAAHSEASHEAAPPPSKMNVPDVELLDQNGRKIHFYTDLVKGHTVVINFIFTTCTTICPPLGATFARVQKELDNKSVRFISISVDPATDTPERLKAWGEKFHAGDGWTFVTGDKPRVDELLNALGAASARREDHSPTILIGNDAHGTWTRAYGLANTSKLVQLINDASAGTSATTAEGNN